jgi:hypothetical protein
VEGCFIALLLAMTNLLEKKMKKNFFILIPISFLMFFSPPLFAHTGPSVGIMGMGNFFLTESQPDLSIGPGGGLLFDYRFNQRWSVETDLFVTLHSGKGSFSGDKDIFLIGAPTFELKFYLRGQENNVDPYLLAGLGVYVLTEGTIDQNRAGVGVGGNFGLGVDFYLLKRLSLGLAAKFPIHRIDKFWNDRQSDLAFRI